MKTNNSQACKMYYQILRQLKGGKVKKEMNMSK